MRQFELSRYSLAYRVLWVLAFFFPVGMGAIPHWTSIFFYVFSFVSLIYLGIKWYFPDKVSIYLLVAFGVFFLTSSLSLINAEDISSGVRRLEKLFFLFCFFPSYFAVQRLKINLSYPFLFGILVAGPVFVFISLYSVYFADFARAQASYSPIIFGDMAMLAALLLLAAYLAGGVPGKYNFLSLSSILASLYAAVLSGSRGAWLALPIVGLFYLWVFRKSIAWKKFAIIAISLVVIVFSLPSNYITQRISKIETSARLYITGEQVNTSEGERLMLWQIALSVWREHPFLGTGIGDFRHETKRKIEGGQTRLDYVYGHAHNIFLDALATTGLLGLSTLVVAFFIVPGRIFISFGLESTVKKVNFPVLAGLAHLVCFAVFGLTEGWLARSPMVSVFLFGLLVFISSAALGGKDA